MVDRRVWSDRLEPAREPFTTLGSILAKEVPEQYFVPGQHIKDWEYLKGPKSEPRVAKNGHKYTYTEGRIPFPDKLDRPSRTILTSEGGTSPSRSNHLIKHEPTGTYRVLMPVECEKLNGFAPGWTEGMPDRWRYFCMGNALVVGLVQRMGATLTSILSEPELAGPIRTVQGRVR
jgi:DNA (cytosine-5)-methyltransferase 1